MKICIIRKSRKMDSYKTVNQLTIEKISIYVFISRQNSKTELCRTLFKNENERKTSLDN